MDTQLETPLQNGQAAAVTVDPLQQINQANLEIAGILELLLKDSKLRQPLLSAIDRQQPVEEGEVKSSTLWLDKVSNLFEVKRLAAEEMVRRAVGGA